MLVIYKMLVCIQMSQPTAFYICVSLLSSKIHKRDDIRKDVFNDYHQFAVCAGFSNCSEQRKVLPRWFKLYVRFSSCLIQNKRGVLYGQIG